MKSFILILLGVIVALLIVGGAVAYSFINESGVNMENKNDGVFLGENESIHFNLIDVLRNIKIDDDKFHKNNALKVYFFVKSKNSGDNYEFNDKLELPFDFQKAYIYHLY